MVHCIVCQKPMGLMPWDLPEAIHTCSLTCWAHLTKIELQIKMDLGIDYAELLPHAHKDYRDH